ncbi:MAG: FkbM family methyltransferase [Vicinamibacterales bacterium]
MKTAVMCAAFEASYDLYKRVVEAPYVAALRAFVQPGTVVVDVGANVGFFTRRFARWTGPGGRVLAIEPEQVNFERLQRMLRARHLDSTTVAVQAAAVERAGEVALAVDPHHPGGHVLAGQGVATAGVTLDDLVETRTPGVISLIKIDVQGAELRVLHGAARSIALYHPALLVELDDAALRVQGASVEMVVDFLVERGYTGHWVSSRGASASVARDALVSGCLMRGYADVLFTQVEGPPPGAR